MVYDLIRFEASLAAVAKVGHVAWDICVETPNAPAPWICALNASLFIVSKKSIVKMTRYHPVKMLENEGRQMVSSNYLNKKIRRQKLQMKLLCAYFYLQ